LSSRVGFVLLLLETPVNEVPRTKTTDEDEDE
jgi:hypothetical protein